jgi:hypothetical protein
VRQNSFQRFFAGFLLRQSFAAGGPSILPRRGGGGRLGIRVPVGARRGARRVQRGFGRGGRCLQRLLLLPCGRGLRRGPWRPGIRRLALIDYAARRLHPAGAILVGGRILAGARGRGGESGGHRALAIWFPGARGRRRHRARWRRCFPDVSLIRRIRAGGVLLESGFRIRPRPCVLRWLQFVWIGGPGGCGCARLLG